MPKIQIEIPNDAYQKLKLHAKDDDRSLTKYITRGVQYLSNIPNGYHNNPIQTNKNIIDLSTLPENTVIRTTASKRPTRPKFPRRNLIQEAYEKEGIFSPRVHNNDDDPFTDKEFNDAIRDAYPYSYSHPDILLLKEYYDSFNTTPAEQTEARERFIALSWSMDLRVHEEAYLNQVFKFVPPVDEPELDISTYIRQLAMGGYYDDTTFTCLSFKNEEEN